MDCVHSTPVLFIRDVKSIAWREILPDNVVKILPKKVFFERKTVGA